MAGYLICATRGNFGDDVDARCAQCAAPIQHRPHSPPDLVKICLACATAQLQDGARPQITVTTETLREVALYYATPEGERH